MVGAAGESASGSSSHRPADGPDAGDTGGAAGWSAAMLSVLLADRDGIVAITSFMNPGLFAAFDLPLVLPATPDPT